MSLIKTREEISLLRKGGSILRETLNRLEEKTQPGITTKELDRIAGELLKKAGVAPSFLGYDGFPGNLCISLNDEVVHGIPSDYIVREGDLVSLDLGVKYQGLFTDAGSTFCVGNSDAEKVRILEVCRECLKLAIKKAIAGNRVGAIGEVVEEHAFKNGYSVVRKLVGHGVGHKVHEAPQIPNYGDRDEGMILQENMCLALEPMIYKGDRDVELKRDGWAFASVDGSPTCYLENTIVVGKKRAEIIA